MQIDEYFSSNLTHLENTVKNLKISVISICFCFICILIDSADDIVVYHDIGPCHIDANVLALVNGSHSKTKIAPVLPEALFSFIIPEPSYFIDIHTFDAVPSTESLCLAQLPSRASPPLSI
jgi:hypothetical protein